MALTPRAPLSSEPGRARRAVGLTLAGLWWEGALRAFWPALTVLSLGLALLALGVLGLLPPRVAVGVTAVLALALFAAAAWGIARFRRPQRASARARVDATLPGAPLSALADRMALGTDDAGAQALWGAHLARMEARVALAELFKRIRGYEVDEANAVRVHSSNVRGFAHLPIHVEIR